MTFNLCVFVTLALHAIAAETHRPPSDEKAFFDSESFCSKLERAQVEAPLARVEGRV